MVEVNGINGAAVKDKRVSVLKKREKTREGRCLDGSEEGKRTLVI